MTATVMATSADNSQESSYYGYNPHADVEQIASEPGDTRATCGYTAYGKNDDKFFTGVDKPDPVDPRAKEEYNLYRFNAKRWDNSTGMYDMGRDARPWYTTKTTISTPDALIAAKYRAGRPDQEKPEEILADLLAWADAA